MTDKEGDKSILLGMEEILDKVPLTLRGIDKEIDGRKELEEISEKVDDLKRTVEYLSNPLTWLKIGNLYLIQDRLEEAREAYLEGRWHDKVTEIADLYMKRGQQIQAMKTYAQGKWYAKAAELAQTEEEREHYLTLADTEGPFPRTRSGYAGAMIDGLEMDKWRQKRWEELKRRNKK